MSDHDHKKQKARSGKSILGGITGLTGAAKEAAEEAEDNARTPVDRVQEAGGCRQGGRGAGQEATPESHRPGQGDSPGRPAGSRECPQAG